MQTTNCMRLRQTQIWQADRSLMSSLFGCSWVCMGFSLVNCTSFCELKKKVAEQIPKDCVQKTRCNRRLCNISQLFGNQNPYTQSFYLKTFPHLTSSSFPVIYKFSFSFLLNKCLSFSPGKISFWHQLSHVLTGRGPLLLPSLHSSTPISPREGSASRGAGGPGVRPLRVLGCDVTAFSSPLPGHSFYSDS